MILYSWFKEWYKVLIVILTPILLIPIPLLIQGDVNISFYKSLKTVLHLSNTLRLQDVVMLFSYYSPIGSQKPFRCP